MSGCGDPYYSCKGGRACSEGKAKGSTGPARLDITGVAFELPSG
jgi:hypothetical protein